MARSIIVESVANRCIGSDISETYDATSSDVADDNHLPLPRRPAGAPGLQSGKPASPEIVAGARSGTTA